MFNIGAKEILVLAVVIMILFGSKKLTELARGLGQSGKELKKAKKEFTQALGQVEETAEGVKKTFDLNKDLKENNKPARYKKAKKS